MNKIYGKLYFLWYFDDDEGFGIEIMAEKPGRDNFICLVNWSFGFGTAARDLRRAWGDYVAGVSQQNNGIVPPSILELKMRNGQNQKNIEKIKALLKQ